MENFMRARVAERLGTLGISAFEAAKAADLNRYIVFDLIEGKKETIRQKAVEKLAPVLQCDPEYLIGAQAEPRRGEGVAIDVVPAATSIPLRAICEAGAWRKPGSSVLPDTLPIPPHPKFPAEAQAAYLVRGGDAAGLGILDGDTLVAVEGAPVRDGDIVVVRRKARGAGVEISARLIKGSTLISGAEKVPGIEISDAEILGRVITQHREY